MKENDQQITLLKDEMKQMKECNATADDQYAVTVSGLDATDGTPEFQQSTHLSDSLPQIHQLMMRMTI